MPVVGDVDGDNTMDIVCGAGDWNLYAFHKNASLISGFPIHFGIRIEQSPALYDIDNDGHLELMVGANDFKFWVFNLNSRFYEWPKFRYDPYNSGCYKSIYWAGLKEGIVKKSGDKFYFGITPNPFKQRLKISYQLPDTSNQSGASIKIFDIAGRVVKSFVLETGIKFQISHIFWDGSDDLGRKLPSGVYFVKLETRNFKGIKKAVLLK